VLRGTSPAATGAALRWPQFRAQLPPRARWARRAGLPMWRICRSFVEANAGTRTPDPLLTMEKRGTCSHGAQCRLSSGIGLDYASDGRAADPARCGRIPAVSAPNGRLGVSLASGAMCRLRGAPLPSRGRRTLGTPDETAALMGERHSEWEPARVLQSRDCRSANALHARRVLLVPISDELRREGGCCSPVNATRCCGPPSSALGPPHRADRGNRAQVLDQHPVGGESALA
jgi:hypothetical protein